MFEWQWPWLLLLLPLPWLATRLLPAAADNQPAIRVPFYQTVRQLQDSSKYRPAALTRSSWPGWLIWSCLLVAAAGPRWIGEPVQLPASGRDLMLAVDLSESMLREDMVLNGESANRLIAVKAVVSDFLERRPGDRIGLIVFADQAYMQSPLTFDHKTVQRFLVEAQIGFAGKRTAIGDAVGLAVKRLRQRPADRHVLILLTDGANTAGAVAPLDAASLAAQENITIYTIGIGADEMVQGGLLFSRRINPSRDLDETTLRGIAEQTGGRYFRARNPQQLMEIYALLDQLEPISDEGKFWRPKTTLFHWPLAIALLLTMTLWLRWYWLQRQQRRHEDNADG